MKIPTQKGLMQMYRVVPITKRGNYSMITEHVIYYGRILEENSKQSHKPLLSPVYLLVDGAV